MALTLKDFALKSYTTVYTSASKRFDGCFMFVQQSNGPVESKLKIWSGITGI